MPTTTITATTTTTTSEDVSAPAVRLLILPGLGGSGPEHWQTRWQTLWELGEAGCARVCQRDWDRPELGEWLATVDDAIAAAGGPVALVAHSLACALVAHGARRPGWASVVAALLVAPADVESPARTPPETRGFAPLPAAPLPFPATVVASHDDPYVELARARDFARRWGARFVDVGVLGHINAASGLGDWPEGRAILDELLDRAGAADGVGRA
jgi:predicted alpha/beta hydrolase family esterase